VEAGFGVDLGEVVGKVDKGLKTLDEDGVIDQGARAAHGAR
jgi:hypothetical protein